MGRKAENRDPFPDGSILPVLHLPDSGRQEPPGGALKLIPGHDHCHRIFKLSDQKRSCPREPHSMV